MLDLMIAHARAAQARAHAPYSRHPVGACVRGAGGGLYAGCNVENVALPLGQCAEAGAIAAMVLAGETRISEVVVLGPTEALCTPCGGCRQRLLEFADPSVPVHVCSPAGVQLSTTLGALLPHAFGPANLAAKEGRAR